MRKQKQVIFIFLLTFFSIQSCDKMKKTESSDRKDFLLTHKTQKANIEKKVNIIKNDTIILSTRHKNNKITCDLDGDKFDDIVEIVINTKKNKSGLRITYGNKNRIDYFGMGKDVLGQDFDEIDWAQIFDVVPKGKVSWNNVNIDGEIIADEDVKEKDKVKLVNDGIFIHNDESCGGGIIFLNKGKYEWIQRE